MNTPPWSFFFFPFLSCLLSGLSYHLLGNFEAPRRERGGKISVLPFFAKQNSLAVRVDIQHSILFFFYRFFFIPQRPTKVESS